MKKIKSFLQRAWEILSCIFIILACIVAFVILLLICLVVELINLFLKPFGKKIDFDPFPSEEDLYGYDY